MANLRRYLVKEGEISRATRYRYTFGGYHCFQHENSRQYPQMVNHGDAKAGVLFCKSAQLPENFTFDRKPETKGMIRPSESGQRDQRARRAAQAVSP
ncbi:hypothetical protein [Roseovarius spongiae]|uniref:hypothetical protein n=1 Tax=Roseovarius spongiae TaxID=2320272 RepID=UPI0011C358E9|nr:hypothetical protein [Roseovarius spongiae]